MTTRRIKHGGGWPAIRYALRKGARAGGLWRFYKALRSKNACKTCALGMGGQLGGMVNEQGRSFEVCKKSIQAMAADMQGAIREGFFEEMPLEKLAKFSPRELEAAGRLTQPLLAGPLDMRYRAISWDEALDRVVNKLRNTKPDESFFYFSGRSSNEAAFLLQLLARLYGTNNVNNCSYFCHQASGVGLSSVTGSGTATIVLDDIEHADLIFLIGANPSSNHPRLMKSLAQLRRRGGNVIVINPLREVGLVKFKVPSDWRSMLKASPIASLYVQPHIGGDIALLAGIAKDLLERGAVDHDFVNNHADGWTSFKAHIETTSWDELIHRGGVDRPTIPQCADLYTASKNTIFCWAMGVTHHSHGVENVQMIANLAMMRGMLGRPHAGLLPLRGHSNVQGVGSMGVTPKLKDAIFDALQNSFGVTLPTTPGMDTLQCIERAHAGDVRFALCLGGNLFGSNPDARFASKALANIDTLVYLNTTLNTGHVAGRGRETIILPVLARDEEPQPTTQESMFNYVRMSDGGKPRHEGPRSEIEIVASVAERLFDGDSSPIDWSALREHRNIRRMIAATVPGYEAIGEIDATKREFHIAGRTFHEPTFATDTGRAKFHVVPLPPLHGSDDGEASGSERRGTEASGSESRGTELRLMTIRSEGQFNTVVYEDEDIYRGQERRDVILLNRDDIKRLGLRVNQPVTVRTETGAMPNVLVREFDVPAGNAAMYYPEANVLIPRVADARSRTPAFKNVLVRIES